MGQGRAGDHGRPDDVRLDQHPPQVFTGVLKAAQCRETRGVHHGIQPTEDLGSLIGDPLTLLGVPYIARQGEAVAAGFGGGLFEAVDPAGCERYVGTRGGTERRH